MQLEAFICLVSAGSFLIIAIYVWGYLTNMHTQKLLKKIWNLLPTSTTFYNYY